MIARPLGGLATLLLITLLPGVALAQDARLEARLDPVALAGVGREVASAREAGLPVEPLIQKALEGAALAADGPRIVGAVRGLRERLAAARDALGPGSTESELVAGAGALYVDVPADALRRIREDAERAGVDLPLVVLADLVQQGVAPASAVQAIRSLARAGADPEGYHLLRYRVELDIRDGTLPTTAAERQSARILRSLRGGAPPPGGG